MQKQVQAPQQESQPSQPSQTKGRKSVSKKAWIIFICIISAVVLIILVLTILSIVGILPANVATILSAVVGALGLIASIISLYPKDSPESQVTDTPIPYHIEHIEHAYFGPQQPADDPTKNEVEASEDIILVPESLPYKPDVLTHARTIQQRVDVVRQVYAQLIQPDISSVVMTGIGGQGKSTLAALVFNYAEQQRRLDASSYFQDEALWLSVKEDDTFQMLAEAIMKALQKAILGFGKLPLNNQLAALLNAIRAEQKPRLLVINQFEYLLDEKTGEAKTDRAGVREFIDALDRETFPSRILLTSRPLPQGRTGPSGTCLVEYAVNGLTNAEGVDLLRKQVKHIAQQATDQELQLAVRRCEGHGYALRLLASRLQRDASLKVQELLNNSAYAHLWGKDIAVKLLDDIYTQHLNDSECQLLCSFSVYREAVPLEAAKAIMDIPYGDATSAHDALLMQHLLLATGNNSYQLHAIVADYAATHFVSSDEQANADALRNAHEKAAQYYLQQKCPEPDDRRQLKDVHPFVEAVQHYCAAEQWQKAYELLSEERLFPDLRTWGENSVLLEVCEMLIMGNKMKSGWQATDEQIALVYNNVAVVTDNLGEKEKALEYFEQALRLMRAVGDRGGEGTTLNNLGGVYDDLGEKEKALEYFEQALRLRRAVGDRGSEGTTLNNLGRVYNALGEKEKALEYFEQALHIHKAVRNPAMEGITLHNIGMIYLLERHDLIVGVACILLAKKLFEKVQSPSDVKDEVRVINSLRQALGEQQVAQLLAEIEPRAQQIVDEALSKP